VLACDHGTAPSSPRGHIHELPSGSFRAMVYAGIDPLTGRDLWFTGDEQLALVPAWGRARC
jgi:hypothetical protein